MNATAGDPASIFRRRSLVVVVAVVSLKRSSHDSSPASAAAAAAGAAAASRYRPCFVLLLLQQQLLHRDTHVLSFVRVHSRPCNGARTGRHAGATWTALIQLSRPHLK